MSRYGYSKRMVGATKVRLVMQAEIIEKYGQAAITKAKRRLCNKCACFCRGLGLPITLEGKDCQYYLKKKEE